MQKAGSDCDLVMEGGVTSAVIYAGLVARLSVSHRLHSLGGTSAGAVAAAAAAIAEAYRRDHGGSRRAFNGLNRFVAELSSTDDDGRTALERLFQPAPSLRRVFALLLFVLRRQDAPWPKVLFAAVAKAVSLYPIRALLGVALGAAMQACLWTGNADLLRGWSLVAALGPPLLVGLLCTAVGILVELARGLNANHFGLCIGRQVAGEPGPALTDRLHMLFNGLSGRSETDDPVCLRTLWWPQGQPPADGAPRDIELQVITTALQMQRPLQLPGTGDANPLVGYFFDADEWADFFPPPVLRWLVQRARPTTLDNGRGGVLLELPPAEDWPIVMLVRMSLSFPLLISALPLYRLVAASACAQALDDGLPEPRAARVYFTDGGITSNCPVDLFDEPLPRWPTFVVNLFDASSDRCDIRLSDDPNAPETGPKVIPPQGEWRRLFDFAARIVMTGLQWRDSLARALPGYRERVLHIGVPAGLGGLNLCMGRAQIRRLAAIGKVGAICLQRFDKRPSNLGDSLWELHRWIRLRSTVASLQSHLRRIEEGLAAALAAGGFQRLLRCRPSPRPVWSGLDAADRADALLAAVRALANAPGAADLEAGLPEPRPTLRLRPPL